MGTEKLHAVSAAISLPFITLLTLIEISNLIALIYFRAWRITTADAESFIIRKSWIIYGLIIINVFDSACFFLDFRQFPFEVAIFFKMLKDVAKASNLIALFYFRPWIFVSTLTK